MAITWRSKATSAQRAAIPLAVLALGTAGLLLVIRKPWQWGTSGEMRIIDHVRIWSWWAAAANAMLLAGLAASARWWAHTGPAPLPVLPRSRFPRWFWPLCLAATLLCAVFGARRLGQSFWDDEVYAMRRAIHGQWKRSTDGAARFRPVKWHETFWFFEKPQHVLHSVVSRLVLDGWRSAARPRGLQFREDIVRIPSFLAGVLSVPALALLLWRLGFPSAGVIAAFLLALHPWNIRYSTELRAYSMMLLVLPSCLACLVEAIHSGRWRWWGCFGGLLFVLMYSNALNIYPAAGIGLCGLAALAGNWRKREARDQLARFAVVTLAAGMIFLQLMLPCVPQFVEYLHTTAVYREMDLRWIKSFLALLFAGAPWSSTNREVSQYVELYPWAAAHPAAFFAIVALTIFFIALGAVRLTKKGTLPALIALALLAPAPAAYVIARLRHQHLFEWYLLFLLPGVVASAALGIDWLRSSLSRGTAGVIAGILLVAAILGGYAAYTAPQRTWLTTRPIQQIRESAEVMRGSGFRE